MKNTMETGKTEHIFSDEVLGALTSIQDLLVLAERYQNHPETSICIALVSTCVLKLQMNIKSQINGKEGLEELFKTSTANVLLHTA